MKLYFDLISVWRWRSLVILMMIWGLKMLLKLNDKSKFNWALLDHIPLLFYTPPCPIFLLHFLSFPGFPSYGSPPSPSTLYLLPILRLLPFSTVFSKFIYLFCIYCFLLPVFDFQMSNLIVLFRIFSNFNYKFCTQTWDSDSDSVEGVVVGSLGGISYSRYTVSSCTWGSLGSGGSQAGRHQKTYQVIHTRVGALTHTHTHAQARTVGHSTESVSVFPRTAWDIFQSFSFAFAFLPCYFFCCFSFCVFLFGLCLWAQRSKRDRTLQRATSVCWEIETKSQIENGNSSEAAAAAPVRWARDKEQQREGERANTWESSTTFVKAARAALFCHSVCVWRWATLCVCVSACENVKL